MSKEINFKLQNYIYVLKDNCFISRKTQVWGDENLRTYYRKSCGLSQSCGSGNRDDNILRDVKNISLVRLWLN